MNILFITDDFPPYNKGGAGISSSLVVKYLSEKNNCYVLTMKSSRKSWSFNNVPVLAVLDKAESQNQGVVDVIMFGIKIFKKIIRDYITILNFVRKNDVDVINIVATNYFSALQIISLVFIGKPVVVDVRDLYLFHTLSYLGKFRSSPRKRSIMLRIFFKIFTLIEELIFRLETGILKIISKSGFFKIHYIALSNYISKELINYGYPKDKITVIYNISDLKSVKRPIKNRINQVVFAGRIESEKGIWVAIKAWETVTIPFLKLHFIGEGSRLVELKEYVKNKKINNVKFSGKLSNEKVIEIYQKSKIIIAPSIWPEPFGRFIQESIASRTPVIATKVGGIPEGIKDHENGILIDSNNSIQLANAIVELFKDKKLYNRLVENLGNDPLKYSPGKILNQRLKIYERIIKV